MDVIGTATVFYHSFLWVQDEIDGDKGRKEQGISNLCRLWHYHAASLVGVAGVVVSSDDVASPTSLAVSISVVGKSS